MCHFMLAIGSIKPLPQSVLLDNDSIGLEIQVEVDDPLPRRPLTNVPYSLVSNTARSLSCTGCVGSGELGFDAVDKKDLHAVATRGRYSDLEGGPDLSPYAKTADLAPFARTAKSNVFQGSQLIEGDLQVNGSLKHVVVESAGDPRRSGGGNAFLDW